MIIVWEVPPLVIRKNQSQFIKSCRAANSLNIFINQILAFKIKLSPEVVKMELLTSESWNWSKQTGIGLASKTNSKARLKTSCQSWLTWKQILKTKTKLDWNVINCSNKIPSQVNNFNQLEVETSVSKSFLCQFVILYKINKIETNLPRENKVWRMSLMSPMTRIYIIQVTQAESYSMLDVYKMIPTLFVRPFHIGTPNQNELIEGWVVGCGLVLWSMLTSRHRSV